MEGELEGGGREGGVVLVERVTFYMTAPGTKIAACNTSYKQTVHISNNQSDGSWPTGCYVESHVQLANWLLCGATRAAGQLAAMWSHACNWMLVVHLRLQMTPASSLWLQLCVGKLLISH